MLQRVSETLFSTTTVLWLVASAAAAVLLFGAMTGRRARLTAALREHVERQRGTAGEPESGGAAAEKE